MKEDPRVHIFTPEEKFEDAVAGARQDLENLRAEWKHLDSIEIPKLKEQIRRAKDDEGRDLNRVFTLQEKLEALVQKRSKLSATIDKVVQEFEENDVDQQKPTLH